MTSLFSLFWLPWLALGLAALPVLIHLINMMRHRRVRWAAMDFLLASYKKHRNWIWLKQLLLLLMRMAALVLLLFMLAGMSCRGDYWASLFGGQTTHHYVLLDDSYSMSDRTGGASAFDNANLAVARIGTAAAGQSNQKFTLIRFSRAVGFEESGASSGAAAQSATATPTATGAAPPADGVASAKAVDNSPGGRIADINAEPVDTRFDLLLEERSRGFDVSDTAVGPRDALAVVRQLVAETPNERAVVYIVSDFRTKQWENPTELTELLASLRKSHVDVELVRCVKSQHANVAITSVQPADETHAAGVPLPVNVQVRNNGTSTQRNVSVKVRTKFFDPAAAQNAAMGAEGESVELPTLLIDQIRPGETATAQVQAFFRAAGQHVVEAELAHDSVVVDNRRWCVVDLPEAERALIIAGSADQTDAYFLQALFEPEPRALTGVRPVVENPAYLRDVPPETLRAFSSVYLLDVPSLDRVAIEKLENYVADGGGVAFFGGPNMAVGATQYNETLYRGGEGLFPLPLDPLQRDNLLPVDPDSDVPDIQVSDHFLFQPFLGRRNTLIGTVGVERFVQAERAWSPRSDSTVEVAARLRNGAPFVVTQSFGSGRVAVVLTTLAPDWNNWAGDPTLVVVALKLQSYLASGSRHDSPRLVGSPIAVDLPADEFRPEITFLVPEGPTSTAIERIAAKSLTDPDRVATTLGGGPSGTPGETNRAGVYEALLTATGGERSAQRYALNVDPAEGDLTLADSQRLVARLQAARPRFLYWDEFRPDPAVQSAFSWSRYVLYAMIGLLLCEQALAYSASYHTVRGATR